MRWTRPKVTLLGRMEVDLEGVQGWLTDHGVKDVYVVLDSLSDSPAEMIVGLAGKRCYKSFEPGLNPNVKRVRGDHEQHLTHMLEVGHGSVLEHANFTFGIEGVSRVFTGEMNRHRAGMAISEGSMRFISFEDLVMVEPPSFRGVHESAGDQYDVIVCGAVEAMASAVETRYRVAMAELKSRGYDDLPMERKKELTSALRRGVPMGIATGGMWTGNVRALRHVITMRADPAAEEEIREVALLMLAELKLEMPVLFGDFTEAGVPTYRKV